MSTDSPNSFQETVNSDFIAYRFKKKSSEAMINNSTGFYNEMASRRSARDFSADKVSFEKAVKTADSVAWGANKETWTFCATPGTAIQAKIRSLTQKEEYENYMYRMNKRSADDIKPVARTPEKPPLEDEPYLIVIFKKSYEIENGEKIPNYYVNESVVIATGFLLCAQHKSGSATLTYTPTPMTFLSKILNRPDKERPYLLMTVGYPKSELKIPNIDKHPVNKILREYK